MWSAPAMSPLAIAGAAPRTTTNRIASSDSLNRRMASGNHAIDGMVCTPVMSEPTAARTGLTRATTLPTATPMTVANGGHAIVAIAVQGPVHRLPDDRLPEIARRAQTTATRIAPALAAAVA